MNSIKLYWWRSKSLPVNFGDALNPIIVERVSGKPVKHAGYPACDMLAIGSLLDAAARRSWRWAIRHPGKQLPVWGTGSFGKVRGSKFFKHFAVRGPMTRDVIGLPETTVLGDPALLMRRFISAQSKKHRWGVIPHFMHEQHPMLQQVINELGGLLIDVKYPDAEETCRSIQQCDFILSSSLHGLIIADAFSIPSVWLRIPPLGAGDFFKFHDYAESVGRELAQVKIGDPLENLEAIATVADPETIDAICDNLVASFPLR